MYSHNEAHARDQCCRGKSTNITYSEAVCVHACVASVIQRTKRMYHTISSSVASPVLSCFSTVTHQRHDFRKYVTECKMCVVIFSTTFA